MTLWSRLKTHLRMKPCGAECWWDSWATILLFLRLSSCQPLVKLILADDLQHAVHLVVAEPAQFRASDFEVTSFAWSTVHMDSKTGHGLFLEAHGGERKPWFPSFSHTLTSNSQPTS